jgi:hypothetical protein
MRCIVIRKLACALSNSYFYGNFRRKPPRGVACGCEPATMPARRLYTRGPARGMAQSGSASALGAEGRGFESLCPDHIHKSPFREHGQSSAPFMAKFSQSPI